MSQNRPRQAHFTTINSGSAVVYSSTKEIVTDMSTYTATYYYSAFGFDAGSDYYAYGPGSGLSLMALTRTISATLARSIHATS